MFSLNGVALDNPAYGWEVNSTSKPYAGITRRSGKLEIAGRRGTVGTPSDEASPVLTLVVRTPEATADALLALFDADPLILDDDGREAAVELLSATPEHRVVKGRFWYYVTALLRMNGVYWRDPADTTSAPANLGASTTVTILDDLSAPVDDAILRIKGQATGLVITDSGGTRLEYGAEIPTGSYLRYECATRRAWVTTTDTWVGGTEVTGNISSGRYPLEIRPYFTDPATRSGRLTVTTTARSGAQIEVRGSRAFRV